MARPAGKLIWLRGERRRIHVGAAAAAGDPRRQPGRHALFTTGTVTSRGAARRAAAATPRPSIRAARPARRGAALLDHWRPDAALWVESDLWPNALEALRARRRYQRRSSMQLAKELRRLAARPAFAAQVLSTFRRSPRPADSRAADESAGRGGRRRHRQSEIHRLTLPAAPGARPS